LLIGCERTKLSFIANEITSNTADNERNKQYLIDSESGETIVILAKHNNHAKKITAPAILCIM